MRTKLAIQGGEPAHTRPWPRWPRSDEGTVRNVLDVLRSERWTLSGEYDGRQPYEDRFAEAFAAYNGTRYCVPVSSGSAAMAVAAEALGVGYGDEVLVPGLAWVACASAVAALGALPILVDIDPKTLCISPAAAEAAITSRTKLIMIVHSYCTLADLSSFLDLSSKTGLPILEDCSHAHGALWNGRRAGSVGAVGVFSMQQTKVLTSGEGGAVVTNDPRVAESMQQLRADGRTQTKSKPSLGQLTLEPAGEVQGHNMCLSELQAAVLLDRLQHLDEENRRRELNAAALSGGLQSLGGMSPLARGSGVDHVTYYRYCVRVNRAAFAGLSVETISEALRAELQANVHPVDDPLKDAVLYSPLLSSRTTHDSAMRRRLDPKRFVLPEAARARRECLCLPHKLLLGDESDVADIVEAFRRVKQCSEMLSRSETAHVQPDRDV